MPPRLGSSTGIFAAYGRRECGKSALLQAMILEAGKSSLCIGTDYTQCIPREFHRGSVQDWLEQENFDRINAFTDDPEETARAALTIGDCVYYCDEVDLVSPSARSWTAPSVQDIVRRGRHIGSQGVSMICNGQRFVNCHGDIISLAKYIAVFEQTASNDIERVRRDLGDDYATQLEQGIPEFHFLLWPKRLICKVGFDGSPSVQYSF